MVVIPRPRKQPENTRIFSRGRRVHCVGYPRIALTRYRSGKDQRGTPRSGSADPIGGGVGLPDTNRLELSVLCNAHNKPIPVPLRTRWPARSLAHRSIGCRPPRLGLLNGFAEGLKALRRRRTPGDGSRRADVPGGVQQVVEAMDAFRLLGSTRMSLGGRGYAACRKSPSCASSARWNAGRAEHRSTKAARRWSLVTMSVWRRMRSTVDIIRSPAVKRSPSR